MSGGTDSLHAWKVLIVPWTFLAAFDTTSKNGDDDEGGDGRWPLPTISCEQIRPYDDQVKSQT
jgi:hypothetical protein